MDNKIVYNPVATPDVIVNLPADDQYAFDTIENLEAEPEKAAEGLALAIKDVAVAISNLLR